MLGMAPTFLHLVFFQILIKHVTLEELHGEIIHQCNGKEIPLFNNEQGLSKFHPEQENMVEGTGVYERKPQNIMTSNCISKDNHLKKIEIVIDANNRRKNEEGQCYKTPNHHRIRRQTARFHHVVSKTGNENPDNNNIDLDSKNGIETNSLNPIRKGTGRSNPLSENNEPEDSEMELMNSNPDITFSDEDFDDGVTVTESDLKDLYGSFNMKFEENDENNVSNAVRTDVSGSNKSSVLNDKADVLDNNTGLNANNKKDSDKTLKTTNNEKETNKYVTKGWKKGKKRPTTNNLYDTTGWVKQQTKHEKNLYDTSGWINQLKRDKNNLYGTNFWRNQQTDIWYKTNGWKIQQDNSINWLRMNGWDGGNGWNNQQKKTNSFGNGRSGRNFPKSEIVGLVPHHYPYFQTWNSCEWYPLYY